jgi:hypothetical protein
MTPTVKRIILNPSLEVQVKAILRRSGGSLYLPSPSTCFTDSSGTTPCAVDDPVGKLLDLIGTNHATQGTAGYKPILRGKVKNWLVNTATLSTQTVSIATSGVAWTLQFKGTGSVAISGGYTGSLAGTGANNLVSLSFTTNAASNLTFTVTGSVTEAMLELGSVANTYVASGATPKSSSYGPYWLDFDGVDDILNMALPAFQMTDDSFAIVAGCKLGGVSNAYLLNPSSNGAGDNRITGITHSNTAIIAGWFDGTTFDFISTNNNLGTKLIFTAIKQNTLGWSRKNRTPTSKIPITASFVPTSGYIGKGLGGQIYSAVTGKGFFSEKDINTIEKYLAKKAEMSL